MEISGHTQPFAVLGHPIGHSLSPVMHNASLQAMELDAIYLAFDVHPDRLMSVLPAMRDMGFGGVNLTVPLKEVAFRGIDRLDESARRLGAVNTVAFLEDGTLEGHNTDGDGFLKAIDEAFGFALEGRDVVVLGSGGAGRAVALTCAAAGAAHVTVTDIDAARARKVADDVQGVLRDHARVDVCPCDPATWPPITVQADLVVQATPIGMKPGEASVLPPDGFRTGQLAFDLIYMFPDTPFTRAAREGGARPANGLGMLLHQGARSFTIWTGKTARIDTMRETLENAVYGVDA